MTNSLVGPSQTTPTSTRREFLSGSSAILAGAAVAGIVTQTACTGGSASSAAPTQNTSDTSRAPAASALPSRPTTTDLVPHCWLDASDVASTGLANAANVTQWADRSGNDYDLQFQPRITDVAGTWQHSPAFLTLNAVNNLPAVSFAAPQQQTLIWAPGGSLDQNLTGFSSVFVIQPDTSRIYGAAFLFITHNADQDARVAILMNPTQGGVRAIVETGGIEYNLPALGSAYTGIPFGALNSPQWGVLSLRVWYGMDPIATLQVNGVSSSIALPKAATPTTPSYINALCSDSESEYLTCNIAEMSFYPGYLADAQLAQIESALRQKYGI